MRETLYRKFESLLFETGALIPLFHDIDYRLAAPRVRGLALRSSLPSVNYAELGLAEPKAADQEARPGSGGTLHVPLVGGVITLDPALSYGAEYADVVPCIYETLTRTPTGPGSFPGWRPSSRPRRAASATASACATTSVSTTDEGSERGTCATRSRGCCSPTASRAGSSPPSAAPARC